MFRWRDPPEKSPVGSLVESLTGSYMWYLPLTALPVWYLWGNWAYVSKATFESGVSTLNTALGLVTSKLGRLVGRVDGLESKTLLKLSEVRRDLAHVESMIATLMEKSNVIEAETRCAAQGVKVLCRAVVGVVDESVDKNKMLVELRAVYNC